MPIHSVSVQPAAGAGVSHVWPALAAALLGLVILFGVGFAPHAAVHDAAHDTRHSFVFPCH